MKSAKRTACLSPSHRADAARPRAAQTGANLITRKARRAFTLAAVALLVLAAMTPAQEREHRHDADAEQQQARDRDRWMWQLPEAVIDAIGVEAGMVVADVGAGDGYFTLRLSSRVGGDGYVYATDIDGNALARLRERCVDDGIDNVATILGEPDDPLLPDGIDLALLVNVIHLVDDRAAFLEKIGNSLAPQGTLVIVQWDSAKMAVEHPDMSGDDLALYSEATVLDAVREAGFVVDRIETFLPVQSVFVCRQQD